MSNIQIYNTSLSNSPIQALYQEGIGGAREVFRILRDGGQSGTGLFYTVIYYTCCIIVLWWGNGTEKLQVRDMRSALHRQELCSKMLRLVLHPQKLQSRDNTLFY